MHGVESRRWRRCTPYGILTALRRNHTTRGADVARRTETLDGTRSGGCRIAEPALRLLGAQQHSAETSEKSQWAHPEEQAGRTPEDRLVGAAPQCARRSFQDWA